MSICFKYDALRKILSLIHEEACMKMRLADMTVAQFQSMVDSFSRSDLTPEHMEWMVRNSDWLKRFIEWHQRESYLQIVGYVRVPELPPSEIVAKARAKIRRKWIWGQDKIWTELSGWDFCAYQDGSSKRICPQGKTYQVLIWRPIKTVSASEVRYLFWSKGAEGNTAAFLTWITARWRSGNYVTYPMDDALLDKGRALYYSGRKNPCRGIIELSSGNLWNSYDSWVQPNSSRLFVGFRETRSTDAKRKDHRSPLFCRFD